MAAPRASSFKALQNLQRSSKRGLHITGVHAAPRPIDPTHKSTYSPWNLSDLRYECRKRTLNASGTRHELVDRLAGHDSLQARAFSMAMRKIASDQTKKPVSGPSESIVHRAFNTSRSMKAVGDTSPVDMTYLPKLFESSWGPVPAQVRVPILPHIESDDAEAILSKNPQHEAAAGGYQDTEGHRRQMKAEISSLGGASAASAMSDVHDGHHATEMSVDALTELADTVEKSARRLLEENKDKDESTIRAIWNGFLDDLFGARKDVKDAVKTKA